VRKERHKEFLNSEVQRTGTVRHFSLLKICKGKIADFRTLNKRPARRGVQGPRRNPSKEVKILMKKKTGIVGTSGDLKEIEPGVALST